MIDAHLLSRLDRLRFRPRRVHTGALRGERLSRRKGVSIEFADYRHYSTGDDVRHLDWNIYGRLDRPVVRTYRDETELPVYLLLDASASMSFGSPSKWSLAQDLAAAVAYIALTGGDAFCPYLLTERGGQPITLRGRSSFRRVQHLLSEARAEGQEVVSSLRRFTGAAIPRGMAVLVSDGLDPAFPEALRQLCGRGHEMVFIHVLSETELQPALEGDLKLLDAETGDPLELTATAGVLREYRRRLDEFCAQLDDCCRRAGAWSVRVRSDTPIATILFRELRRLGVLGLVG